MTDQSAAEIEREAEAARARVNETARELQHKLSPGEMLGEVGRYFKSSDGSAALDNLKTQVRNNPLSLALIGTGLAWLFMSRGPRTHQATHQTTHSPSAGVGQNPTPVAEAAKKGSGVMKSASDAAGSASDTVGAAYRSAGETASSVAGSVSSGAQRAGETVSEAGRTASTHARNMGSGARRMFSDTLDREPLILGALGIAVGAAVAAALPRTRYEDELLTPYRDRMREGVKDAAQEGMETAKDVAAEAVEAGRSEAKRQNLTGEEAEKVKDKAGKVAESATEAAEDAARDKLGQGERKDRK